jgi:hypothetical protein
MLSFIDPSISEIEESMNDNINMNNEIEESMNDT